MELKLYIKVELMVIMVFFYLYQNGIETGQMQCFTSAVLNFYLYQNGIETLIAHVKNLQL